MLIAAPRTTALKITQKTGERKNKGIKMVHKCMFLTKDRIENRETNIYCKMCGTNGKITDESLSVIIFCGSE